jgi:hypothetical protein
MIFDSAMDLKRLQRSSIVIIKTMEEDHEKAEHAWHDHWRYAFVRGSCLVALATSAGLAVVS